MTAREDAERLLATRIQQLGPNTFVAEQRARQLLDAVRAEARHEAAEELRAWGEDGEKRRAVDEDGLPLHPSPFYMWEDADNAADLIDPGEQQ